MTTVLNLLPGKAPYQYNFLRTPRNHILCVTFRVSACISLHGGARVSTMMALFYLFYSEQIERLVEDATMIKCFVISDPGKVLNAVNYGLILLVIICFPGWKVNVISFNVWCELVKSLGIWKNCSLTAVNSF